MVHTLAILKRNLVNTPAHSNKTAAHEAPSFTKVYLGLIAVITSGLGLGLLVLPLWVAGLFFISPGVDTSFFAQMVGSTLIGYAALNALAVYDASKRVCEVAVWSNLVTLSIASIITFTYRNSFDGFGLLVIGQHIVFTIGFIYCAWQLRSK